MKKSDRFDGFTVNEAFTYVGAFRLPGGDERPRTFDYGGNAMTYRPDGDPNGPDDGFPGSLFITGHARLPYGELPVGDQVAEATIPAPLSAESIEGHLQRFQPKAGRYPILYRSCTRCTSASRPISASGARCWRATPHTSTTRSARSG